MEHRNPPRTPSRRWRRVLAQLPGTDEFVRFAGQLRGPERRSAVRALFDGVVVVVTLERRGAGPLFAGRRTPTPADATVDVDRSVRVAAAVDAALGLVPVAPSCLRRSVTLLRELHRLGLAATMHIGVRKPGDDVEAHAWVQVGEVVVNDAPEVTDGYVELASGDLERLFPTLR